MPDPTPEELIAAKFAGLPAPEPTPEPDEVSETVAEETPVIEEPEVAEPASEPEPEPEPAPLLAGKYKSVEELERAYTEAQAAIGRQGNELSELRGLKQEFDALRQEITAPKPQAPVYDVGSIEDDLQMQPHLIPQYAQQALDANDSVLYAKSMAAWHSIDPAGATAFQINAHQRVAQSQLEQRLAPIQQSAQQAEQAQQLAAAFEQKNAEHPDFAQVMNGITEQQLAGFPKAVVAQLETGDADTKAQVLETLYRWSKAEQIGNLADAAQAAAAQTAADAQQARTDATVATTTATNDRVEVTKTPIEQFHEQFQNSPAFRKAAGLA